MPTRPAPTLPCTSDPDRQYPDRNDDFAAIFAAKRVCDGCPIRDACLRAAISNGETHGVWGGFSPGERQRLTDRTGAARRCDLCRLWFVPPGAATGRCQFCPSPAGAPATPAKTIRHRRADIEKWAGQGWSDIEIAAALRVHHDTVRAARKAWAIPSGWTRRRVARGTDTATRPDVIRQVEAGQVPFLALGMAERVQVWRRHTATGGGPGEFVRRFRLSWRVQQTVRAAADRQAPAEREMPNPCDRLALAA